jgi:hypothetical protein
LRFSSGPVAEVGLKLADTFGSFLAEGAKAAAYRFEHIEPYFDAYNELVLDLTGVLNINSSFAHALIVPLVEHHSEEALVKLRFAACNPVVRIMIGGALALGLKRSQATGSCELA